MNTTTDWIIKLPPEQQAIRDKCFHPSGTFVEFPREEVERSIPERFEKIVRMYPDRIAVEMDHESLTYEALNRVANRLANRILAEENVDESPIAIVLPKGIAQAVAILAVLKARKMFLLQDPNSADDELAHIFIDAQVNLVLTSDNTASRFLSLEKQNLRVIEIDAANDGDHDQNPTVYLTAESGAYIKYTSGSTARAKGVMIPHRSVLHAVMSYTNSSHFCSEDRSLQVNGNYISRSFFVHLLNGATLCPFDFGRDGLHRLGLWMKRHQITIYRSFPGAFRVFVNSSSKGELFLKLRIIRLGGEPMYRSDVELFKKHFSPDCILIHSYATSETRVICSYYLDRNTNIIGHRVPVGYAEMGKEVSIVDDQGNEVPAGQAGEIVVKSRFLSSGYWRRSDESTLNFQSSSANPETKIYRTGDLGLLSADGCLTYLGRQDDRIKIRNFRVHISEVEATLTEHPEVKLASVIAKEDSSHDTRLIAYFVCRNKPGPSVRELREYLGAKLPPYTIPSVFVALTEFPLTQTGKIDRRALPDPGKSRPELDTPYRQPRTPVESELVRIWSEVVRFDRIGIDDNFLDLGGHSLAASRIISRIIKTFALDLPLKALFDSPTVAKMAEVIAQNQPNKASQKDLERILTKLEALSEEDAQRVLSKITQNEAF
jgi:amino acid adenylation domain-containing protein